MNFKSFSETVLAVVLLLCSQQAFSLETIDWQSLVPPLDETKDIYSQLPEALQESAADLWWAIDQQANGSNNEPIEDVRKRSSARLEANGIDVDALIRGMNAFAELVEENGTKMVADLNGKQVKMPGYVLPIEYSGTRVVEFLLVPYVGACVHTPPPPANQMVYVKLDEGFESEGLFMPVWVTGKMTTVMTTQAVSFEDGAADIEAGYSIDASNVVPYQ
jgi:hypothetical protein